MSAAVERVPLDAVRDLVRIGEPLPFRVLDALDRLLLSEGQTIATERQFEGLTERGAWAERERVEAVRRERGGGPARVAVAARQATLFDAWETLAWELDAALRAIASPGPSAGGSTGGEAVDAVLDRLLALVDRDADIAVFLCIRQDDRRFALYPLLHAIHVAVLGTLTARQLGWDAARQRTLGRAALTMNVAMLELQARLAEQPDPPSARQREAIRDHPTRAVAMLRAAGIDDAEWLETVATHHERAGGGGYPAGLETVSPVAELLRATDILMAKITPRAHRPALLPLKATRDLYEQENGRELAAALIRAVGVHPPGALVQLKSGEVAVVARRGADARTPGVLALADGTGRPLGKGVVRDTADAAHAIAGAWTKPSPIGRVLPERVYGMVVA